jgi:hypothetical protein
MVRPLFVIGAMAGAVSLPVATTAWAAPQAVVLPAPSDRQQYCPAPARMMVVAAADEGKELAKVEYCALEGKMSAQLYVDHRGKIYVVARTGDRQDPNAEFVRVLDLTHVRDVTNTRDVYNLGEFAAIALPPSGSGTTPATYRVTGTKGGGLELVVEYPASKPDPTEPPPIKRVAIQLGP